MVCGEHSRFLMHPWSAKEHIIGCVHVYDKELIEVLYLIEVGFDSDHPQCASIPFARSPE